MSNYITVEFVSTEEGAKNVKRNLSKSRDVTNVKLLRKKETKFHVYEITVSEAAFQKADTLLPNVPKEDRMKAYLITYGVYG